MKKEEHWDIIIEPKRKWWDIDLKNILDHFDLMVLFVKRDIVAFYKQTILGPFWFVVQPLMTMSVYLFVFGRLAGLSTEGLPGPIFYLTGIVFWTYFSQTLLKVSTTLKTNRGIFGKVYFPRIIVPISIVLSNLFRLLVQLMLLLGVVLYFILGEDMEYQGGTNLLLFPILFILLAVQAFGFGLIVTALTTKYRDLAMLVTFGIQLLMYLTPVIYPLNSLSGTRLYEIISLNPMCFIFEGLRYSLFGTGVYDLGTLGLSVTQTLVILFMGVVIFNRVERGFVDTI